MAIIKSLEYRESFRKTILNYLGEEEVFAFHPQIDNLLFSSKGRVKNLATGRMLVQSKNADNYNMVNVVYRTKGRRCVAVHRLVCETFFGFLGDNNYFYEANHQDGNKDNNTLNNLNWLTRDENLQHARDTGLVRHLKGSENGNSKLKEEDILDIMEFRKLGFTARELANHYKCEPSTINNVFNKKTWKHVER